MTDQQIDEFLDLLAKSPTSARDMVRGLFAAHEAKAAPAVPQGWKLVQTPITEEMHAAAVKVLNRANGIDGLPQRMLDAMLETTPAAPSQAPVTQGEPVACLVRWRRLRTPARNAHDGQDHFSEWSDWRPETLKYGMAVTDPSRNSGPEHLFEMLPLVLTTPVAPSQPAVPQGWKSVLIPTEWTIGPNLFKDWCNQWFGPDADDEYLMRAAHALLGLAATPAAPSQPVTLTDDDIARCINVATCGRPFIGLMNSWGVPSAFSRSLADLLIAALREKEQTK